MTMSNMKISIDNGYGLTASVEISADADCGVAVETLSGLLMSAGYGMTSVRESMLDEAARLDSVMEVIIRHKEDSHGEDA